VNVAEAKEILLLYRPGTADAEDPEIIQAMSVARRDPDLARWFERHCVFQSAMQTKLRQIKVPEHLKVALMANDEAFAPSVPPGRGWWRKPAWMGAAAAVMLLLAGFTVFWLKPKVPDRFADYQQTIVSKAMRGYAMDWEINDMRQLRQHIAGGGAPSDYAVTEGLQKLKLTGGAVFRWRSNPVAMVCFDRGNKQMVFLFVMQKAALKDPPPASPTEARVSDFTTASWTNGEKTYLVAGPEGVDLSNYVPKL
jgi:hypothetical protein